MEICKLEHITKNYRMGELVTPLKDICLTVCAGDFVAIEGPSGIGKSTLLYVIGSLLESDGGSLQIEGVELSSLSDEEKTRLRAEKIGFLFQDTNLIQALTLRENLELAQTLGGKRKADPARVEEMLELLGLTDRAGFYPYQLSGGQRRRAVAARALIHRPRLIIADEPTNDLDDHWADVLVRLLKAETEKGAAVIMVTHNSRWTQAAGSHYCLADGVLAPC